MLGGNEAGSAYYHYYRLSLVALLFAKPVGLYDCMLQSSSRSERVKNVLRPKIGDYFSGGLMEHGILRGVVGSRHFVLLARKEES